MTEPKEKDKPTATEKADKSEDFTIEELAAKLHIPRWVSRGMMTAYNWGIGKRLTEKEFTTKKDAWLRSPMSRR